MKTLSYYKGCEREIEVGKKYHLGQLWDGSGDVEKVIEGNGKGSVWIDNDANDLPIFARFTYEVLDPEEPMDTVVEVVAID